MKSFLKAKLGWYPFKICILFWSVFVTRRVRIYKNQHKILNFYLFQEEKMSPQGQLFKTFLTQIDSRKKPYTVKKNTFYKMS
jgi:hypothetical protein